MGAFEAGGEVFAERSAGTDRPLPMPKPPSKTKKDKSLYNPGFWNPSSMTMTSAPDLRAFCAPATRSGLTMTGCPAGKQQRFVADF